MNVRKLPAHEHEFLSLSQHSIDYLGLLAGSKAALSPNLDSLVYKALSPLPVCQNIMSLSREEFLTESWSARSSKRLIK